jgi:hypothetical protein
MAFYSTVLIVLSLMVGWSLQEQRRHRRFSPVVLTLLVSLAAFVLAIRS